MKSNILIICTLFLLLASCEKLKNNHAEKKLEGEWELVKSEYGSKEVDLTGREQIMTFYDSDEEDSYKESMHYGQMSNSYDGYTYLSNFKYAVFEKGTQFSMYLEFNSPTEASMFTESITEITKLNKNYFVMEGENSDGLISKFTFKKRN
jgi:hypothetical protein